MGLSIPELVLNGIRELESNTLNITIKITPHDSPDCSPKTIAGPAVDVDLLLDGQHQQHHVPVLAGQQEVVLEAEDVGGHFGNLSVSSAQGSIARGTMSGRFKMARISHCWCGRVDLLFTSSIYTP